MCNILLVDDDNEVIQTFQNILPHYGFNVIGASKEEEIFDNINKHQPKMILLDVNLNESDGRNICKGLKNHYKTKDIPVLLISAEEKYKEDVPECKAEDFIPKPIKIDHLIPVLKNYCRA